MDREQLVKIRSKILGIAVGAKQTISAAGTESGELEAIAKQFCRSRGLTCLFRITAAGLEIERIEKPQRGSLSPEIDALEVGQSKLFELPPTMHQKIRMACGYRSASGKVRLSCNREGDFMRVTRLPMTESEAEACGPITAPPKVTKYDLERLGSVRELVFNIARPDQQKLRLAVHRQQTKTGWTIRCRLQDDGTMLVYRTDSGAPQAAKQAAE